MPEKEKLKVKLYQALQDKVQQQITILQASIQSIEESRNNETKSSVGDKYETSRAMMQQELFRKQEQLQQAFELQLTLTSIQLEAVHTIVKHGSLVETSQGTYFLSVGLGKVIIEEQTYFAISVNAPIGTMLVGQQQGASIIFRGKRITINDIC